MLFTSLLLFAGAQSVFAKCKCWNALNATVDGQLIANQPIAQSCYPGEGYDAQRCQHISGEWTSSPFQEASPIGYTYPLLETCPPINASVAAYPTCDLGNSPVYTINATKADDVAAGIKFAKENNVRLVIKNTGHDIVGRSQGYGSLSIWIKYIRDGIKYQEHYAPSTGCQSNWTGSALTVGGGYIWDEVYAEAAKHGRIAVGGDDRTVGSIGGYLQGGGHGFTTHFFGLATDQVLEYKVVLASGEIVTANQCQYTDLFTALRGGGGGTYGVVVSATIKAHHTHPVLMHKLSIEVIPGKGTLSGLLNATAAMMSRYPILSDEGFAGYAEPTRAPTGSLFTHTFGKLLESNTSSANKDWAKHVMNQQIVDNLIQFNGTQFLVKSAFKTFPSFDAFFLGSGSHQAAAASSAIMTSRFFDKESLLFKQENLENMMATLFSEAGPGAHATTSALELCLVGGGQVLQHEPYTSVNPAWRKTYLLAEQVDLFPGNAGLQGIRQVVQQATTQKLKAMKELTPGMGTYLNEADRADPDWKQDWFGNKYHWLSSIKKEYDPDEVFWCWRCVGSEGWEEVKGGTLYGPLCQMSDKLILPALG